MMMTMMMMMMRMRMSSGIERIIRCSSTIVVTVFRRF
jgi:hypothetical protein